MKKLEILAITAAILCASVMFSSCAVLKISHPPADPLCPKNYKSEGTVAVKTDRRKAPDITVYDALGGKRSLSEYKGKPVVVNFWASWCGYCKREMPYFEEAYKKYGEDVQFMMVDICDGRAETQASGSALIRGEGYTFPVFFDHDQDASAKYPLSGIPKTYLIDSEGYIVYECPGAIKEDYLDQNIPNLR